MKWFIDKDTVSTIRKENGGYKLTFYDNCKPVFERVYDTFKGASVAEGKLMRKYYHEKKGDM